MLNLNSGIERLGRPQSPRAASPKGETKRRAYLALKLLASGFAGRTVGPVENGPWKNGAEVSGSGRRDDRFGRPSEPGRFKGKELLCGPRNPGCGIFGRCREDLLQFFSQVDRKLSVFFAAGLDRVAKIAGMISVKGLGHAFDNARLLRVANQHSAPSGDLKATPMTAGDRKDPENRQGQPDHSNQVQRRRG